MKRLGLLAWACLAAVSVRAADSLPEPTPLNEPLVPQMARGMGAAQRSISQSGQFVIYCPDVRMRLAVASFAETAKRDVLETLKVGDHWKMPVVIDLRLPSSTDPNRVLSRVQLIQTDGGWKTEVDITLREGQFKDVRFPQLMVRAILLEMAYRDRPPGVGSRYNEPPAWLVEGLAQISQRRATGASPNAPLFRQMIETGKLQGIGAFLRSNVAPMDGTSLDVYDMCAASLVNLLIDMPGGPAGLAKLVKELPSSDGDPVALLLKSFPSLGGSETSLEKWWTLGLARTSVSDGASMITAAETDARLTPILTLSLVTDEKKKTKTDFALSDYKTYLKNPGARPALAAKGGALAVLLARAHPLMRPVVQEYLRIVSMLAQGRSRGMDKALADVVAYRSLIVGRMDKIEDYLNWYEATQMPEQSGAFADYMKSAKAFEKQAPPKRNDAISRYIDQLEREFN
ncbi:MAG: hypothetical protein ACFUZC_21595 [Chthoniobacteraceae bacterium]